MEPKKLRIKVLPDVKREYVRRDAKGVLLIGIKEPAKEGRANHRVRELLSAHLDVPVKNVIIVSGTKARSKMILVYAHHH